ncbi:MAG: serine hydrolase domain-containing protein [Bacteroidia bacterium]|nr:serine hydrolase domain-containing protein [Bacteroidia bacterium]
MSRYVAVLLFLHLQSAAQPAPDSIPAALEARVVPLLAQHSVPGVGLAVVNGGQVVFVGGIGVCESNTGLKVTAQTRFQAASISKPLAALTVLRLVRKGLVSLDEDVHDRLSSWQLPTPNFTSREPLTPRSLLMHRGGINLEGSWGYSARMQPIPSLLQTLTGTGVRKEDSAVRQKYPPGKFHYSTGGYCILEQWLVDALKSPYPTLVQEEVFGPLGMRGSDFLLFPHDSANGTYASGHGKNGVIEGKRYGYPFAAAAGWNTSATDVAQLLVGMIAAWQGRDTTWLRRADLEPLTHTRPGSDYGLGWRIELSESGDVQALYHRGLNTGFLSIVKLYPEIGYGVGILTNSQNSAEVIEAIGGIVRELFPPVVTE